MMGIAKKRMNKKEAYSTVPLTAIYRAFAASLLSQQIPDI
jgi:hypothetical protein